VNQAKQVLGLLGLIAALAGIALNNRILVWVAIGLLGASIVARMIVASHARRSEQEKDTGGESM
jgi:hypothetical protein